MSKNFKVGQLWKTRNGEIASIVDTSADTEGDAFPIHVYINSLNTRETVNRHGNVSNLCETEHDLIHLVENVKNEPELVSMKFRVKDEDHSKFLQRKLFGLGFDWQYHETGGDFIYRFTNAKFLFANVPDMSITLYNDSEFFDNHKFQEFEAVSKVEFVPVTKVETITIDGKEYNKAEVLQALKGMEQ